MPTPDHARTLAPQSPSRGTGTAALPADLLAQSARRLYVQALLYGFGFFMGAVLPSVFLSDARTHLLASPLHWIPPLASLTLAALVAAVTRRQGFSPATVMTIAPVFEILGSLGIAAAQFLDTSQYVQNPPWAGLSWVAVWVLGFAVIVPRPPRHTLVTTLASVATVPLTVAVGVATQGSPVPIDGARFYFFLVLPYLVVVVVAYVCSRVIYNIGAALTQARELGSYRLMERLGEGGMGEVWRADHRLLARPAAVKLMRPDVVGRIGYNRHAEFMARFKREAQATAQLRSPHTVDLYDFGVADDGSLYYVMELLDGFDLNALVERFGPVPPERAVWLLMQICHSLGEAHDEGLVHRDIKPANIYVCQQGRDSDFVKVLDFGLVKSQGSESATELDLSGHHAVGGTPSFMSPEQAQGAAFIDHRTDIYATGCVAYWLLTGRRVFDGETALAVMMQHMQATPVPPSVHAQEPIPQALDALILACLAKNPIDRPASADVLYQRLNQLGIGESWTPNRRQTWWQTHAPKPRRLVQQTDAATTGSPGVQGARPR